MSAVTRFKVRVLKSYEETIEIEAIDRNDAVAVASANPDVIHILSVDWIDAEEAQGSEA